MYVCMCVCNPPLRSRAAASVAKGCSEGEWAQRRPGGVPLGDKAKTKKRQGSRVAPGPRVSAARARAAPSPDRVSSRAPVGAGRCLAWVPPGNCPGGPPWPANAGRLRLQLPTDRAGRGLGRHVLGAGGRVLSAWSVPSARQPVRSKTRSRQSPLLGPFPLTVLPPGGWQGPSRVRSCLP